MSPELDRDWRGQSSRCGIDAVQAGIEIAAIGEIDRGILVAGRDLGAVTQQEGAVIVVGHVDGSLARL